MEDPSLFSYFTSEISDTAGVFWKSAVVVISMGGGELSSLCNPWRMPFAEAVISV